MSLFTIHEDANFLHIEFLNADSANALSLRAARELGALPRTFRGWHKPVVIFSGHPSVFCSGGNLSDHQKLRTRGAGLKINAEITRHLDSFGRWPPVKLAVLEGDVLGGGMEWLARFDFRWSTPFALFAFWQRRLGLSSGWGGGASWAPRIGEAVVRQLLLEARVLSAGEAQSLGLVDRVCSAWRIRPAVAEWAAQMSSPTASPALTLTSWNAKRERQIFSSLWMNETHRKILGQWRGGK